MPGSSPLRPTSLARALVVASTVVVVLAAAGCGSTEETGGPDSTDSTDSTAEPTVVEIEFSGGEVTPNGDRVEVGAGDPVDLEVTADEPGTLHLHTDPEQELSYGEGTETFEIQVDRPGVVVVESHELDQVVVQLEVR